ncbi:pYEATS domain-containing protein [Dethiosulfatarculus sandiegensis]|uniref:pYEATS domain-containing protein n=1 Tax=Dethiosulfatarculus sandiegensis TaxID=1429043 RepID=UPI0012E2E67A|nr:pYEATS domain-containing protein [Dethiosulfatarculus sandiegensis]
MADIVIWLQQHGKGPLSDGQIEKVEYQLGNKFFKEPKVKINAADAFRLEVSAYGPMLSVARIYIKNDPTSLILKRYINFEEPPKKAFHLAAICSG